MAVPRTLFVIAQICLLLYYYTQSKLLVSSTLHVQTVKRKKEKEIFQALPEKIFIFRFTSEIIKYFQSILITCKVNKYIQNNSVFIFPYHYMQF